MQKFLIALFTAAALAYPADSQPDFVVDLGYARHAPSWTNVTTHGTTLLNY